ncbi:MAG TPA: HNH endonuclease signature motif containing protein [Vicinamibacteria bacterium]|nr:HNH endonuclease signature motif containing protein [Vicinamibacteria bacterium]
MSRHVLSKLSDEELLSEVGRLARCEREVTADLVAHLAELESRRLHLAAGFPSLFAYCTAFLRLSEYEAFNRIEAARAARRFPRVLAMLAEGSLTLTTAQLVGRHLTDENHAVLLSAAAGKSKLEVQELLARHQPRPDVPASVRRLPDRAVAPAALLGEAVLALGAPAAPVAADAGGTLAAPAAETAAPAVVATPRAPSPPRYRPPVTPLAPDRYQFTFTGSRETRELLDLAQDMLRHVIPGGDTGEIMKRALEALVREVARKKFAATTRPRKGTGGMKDPGEPSAAARREVWIRDRGRCAYVAGDGRRCNERAFLEFHHVLARARGGPGTVANLQMRCRSHNGYEAERVFGERRPGGEWDSADARAVYWAGTTRSGTTSTPSSPGS